jgi:hypothetical protein
MNFATQGQTKTRYTRAPTLVAHEAGPVPLLCDHVPSGTRALEAVFGVESMSALSLEAASAPNRAIVGRYIPPSFYPFMENY